MHVSNFKALFFNTFKLIIIIIVQVTYTFCKQRLIVSLNDIIVISQPNSITKFKNQTQKKIKTEKSFVNDHRRVCLKVSFDIVEVIDVLSSDVPLPVGLPLAPLWT